MAKFNYTAHDKAGKMVTGTIEAESVETVRSSLKRQNLTPLVVHEKKAGLNMNIGKGKVKLRDMVIFTRQLATMINAGVPLVRSLATLQNQTESKTLKTTIGTISKDIEGGMALADALLKHPSIFSPVYINMVRAGEAGGILDEILNKLAQQQEKDAKIRAKFKSAMTYPTVLLSITGIVFILLMTFIVPKIGGIIGQLAGPDKPLPPMTRYMLAFSHFLTSKWFILLPAAVGTVVGLKIYVKKPAGRRMKDKLLLRVPVLKTVITKVAIARFSRIFASLMSSGVSVLEAIDVTSKAIGNSLIEDELTAAGKQVANGKQLSEPLAESKVFPPIVSQMLAIGEETGQIDQILIKVADFYEEEVDATVDSLSSILEPVMIVIMGAMVAVIALSVIGPISNLANQI